MSLIEKHIISPDFALNKNEIRAIAINEDENICIMIVNGISFKFLANLILLLTTMSDSLPFCKYQFTIFVSPFKNRIWLKAIKNERYR